MSDKPQSDSTGLQGVLDALRVITVIGKVVVVLLVLDQAEGSRASKLLRKILHRLSIVDVLPNHFTADLDESIEIGPYFIL